VLLGVELPLPGVGALQAMLDRLVPVDEATGAEGLSVQGLLLIGLLLAIGAAAWRGLGQVDNGFNRLTPVALGLTLLTLVVAALGVRVSENGLFLA
jgi:hypothetical protein